MFEINHVCDARKLLLHFSRPKTESFKLFFYFLGFKFAKINSSKKKKEIKWSCNLTISHRIILANTLRQST